MNLYRKLEPYRVFYVCWGKGLYLLLVANIRLSCQTTWRGTKSRSIIENLGGAVKEIGVMLIYLNWTQGSNSLLLSEFSICSGLVWGSIGDAYRWDTEGLQLLIAVVYERNNIINDLVETSRAKFCYNFSGFFLYLMIKKWQLKSGACECVLPTFH